MKQISEAFGRRLSGSGLTRIQWIALYYINEQVKIPQTLLSSKMGVNDSSGGRLIDRLERDGLVKRISDEEDRRIHLIILTDEGLRLLNETLPIADVFSAELTRDIPVQDLETFERVMVQMLNNVCGQD